MQARLKFNHEYEIERANKLGITDLNKKYLLRDLASGDSMFAATGVTDGSMLKGVRIILIPDGDVSGIIATSNPNSGIDMYIGVGGAPEGVLAAAALRCIGGQMQARLKFNHEYEIERANKLGITDLNKKYLLRDLASGDSMFAATGVTDGSMLKGVRIVGDKAYTESIVMRSVSGTVRTITATHNLLRKPN